jgi:cob(I)alamin adenosyltransferase
MTGKLEQGCVQVYTGNGKGKTTAALGLAFRALGQGMTVYMGQFLKKNGDGGEQKFASLLPGITLEQFGTGEWVTPETPMLGDEIELAKRALHRAREILLSADYDIVILDEINVALDLGLLDVDEVLDLIESKPLDVELILTGRNAHERIIDRADLVVEIREIKHYFNKAETPVQARTGIEI